MEYFFLGLQTALQPYNLTVILLGTLCGTLIGALPGLGPSVGVALLLPFTYNMPAVSALLLLVALYQAAEYGGSISSILVCAPGTAAATATCLDGYPLCRKGYPGKALGYSLTASTIGGFFGVFILIMFSMPLANFALRFGPPEYFCLGIFGLTAVASLSSPDLPKSVLSVIFGLLLSTIGVDVFTGFPRFHFGHVELYEGVPLIPLLVGLFAISEVFKMIGEDLDHTFQSGVRGLKVWLTLREIRSVLKTVVISGIIGTIVGIFPGLGAGPASWLAYSEAKRRSKTPEKFGSGHPEGIAAPESANNAAVGGALIPLITLGIPGSPTTAIILGALIIQGIEPGPQIFDKMPDLVYGLFAGLTLATGMMYVVGLLTTNIWARVVIVPNWVLAPMVLLLSAIGAYISRNLLFDVWLAIFFGIMGYIMRKLNYSLPSLILGFILGFMVEENLRRSLLLSDGSYLILVTRPISLILLILSVISLISAIKRQRKVKAQHST